VNWNGVPVLLQERDLELPRGALVFETAQLPIDDAINFSAVSA
jgi:hypothetical protein